MKVRKFIDYLSEERDVDLADLFEKPAKVLKDELTLLRSIKPEDGPDKLGRLLVNIAENDDWEYINDLAEDDKDYEKLRQANIRVIAREITEQKEVIAKLKKLIVILDGEL